MDSLKKRKKRILALLLMLIMCINIMQIPVFAVKPDVNLTLHVGDGTPTGTKMKVGDYYDGNWYVAEITTSYVKFGSQQASSTQQFTVPAPEDIWTGVSHNYKTILTYSTAFNGDKYVGATAQIFYTGGNATYQNVINTEDTEPYVNIIHTY